MSANNWTYCPQCIRNGVIKTEAARRKAAASYGKVSADEYAGLLADADNEERIQETMREDYELGVDRGGEFEICYSCSCDKCGFRFTFKHKEDAKVNQDGTDQ